MEELKSNDIRKLISERIQLSRVKQSELANRLNTSQAKLSQFINSDSEADKTLRTEELNKLFDLLGINTYIYYNRCELAKEVAKKLRRKKLASEEVSRLTKKQMAILVDDERVNVFFDVDEQDFEQIKQSNLIDVESTYLFFNSIVRCYLLAGENPTPLSIARAVNEIGKEIIGEDKEIDISNIVYGVFGIAPAMISISLFSSILPIAACGVISGFLKNKHKKR